jgi:hypothetical protein
MRKRARDNLIDDVMDAYVDWRQESAEAEFAYRRWATAPSADPARAFAVYAAALDREELASISYAQLIRRTAVVFERDRRRGFAAAQHRVTRRPTRPRRRKGTRRRTAGPRAAGTRWGRGSVRSGRRAG